MCVRTMLALQTMYKSAVPMVGALPTLARCSGSEPRGGSL